MADRPTSGGPWRQQGRREPVSPAPSHVTAAGSDICGNRGSVPLCLPAPAGRRRDCPRACSPSATPHAWTKAGVMIREFAVGQRAARVCDVVCREWRDVPVLPAAASHNRQRAHGRLDPGAPSHHTASGSCRSGNVFRAYESHERNGPGYLLGEQAIDDAPPPQSSVWLSRAPAGNTTGPRRSISNVSLAETFHGHTESGCRPVIVSQRQAPWHGLHRRPRR